MNLKKLLGLQTAQEKVEEYKGYKNRLKQLDELGQELADKFMLQKSIIDDIATLPENKRTEVFDSYNAFMKSHQKEVSAAVSERARIIKSMEKLRNDDEVGKACSDIDLLDEARSRFKAGTLAKSVYFDIIKSVTGEPTKYADVLAFNKQGQLLILHRVTDFTPNGTVCIPGGHVDPGEDFMTAALRELQEETNLDPLPEAGVLELGEYKTADAHIKYYQVAVDEFQPVTCDAMEHCYHEWINPAEVPLRPFIFDQGKIVTKFLMQPHQEVLAMPLMKALEEGRITPDLFVPAFSRILKKAIGTDDAKPLMPESMDSSVKTIAQPAPPPMTKKKVIVPVRDPMKNLEQVMKAIDGESEIKIGDSCLKLDEPIAVFETKYKSDPTTNRLTECEIVYDGDEVNMRILLDKMRSGLLAGSVKVRTLNDDFLMANENGTDYVGDAVFVPL